MLRNKTASFFLVIAYILFLGHNIIPHHHHESGHELSEHHKEHHQHTEEEKDLSHLLSHFVHATDGFTITVHHHNLSTALPLMAILADCFSLDRVIVHYFTVAFLQEPLIYISPHEFSFGNKAPPFC